MKTKYVCHCGRRGDRPELAEHVATALDVGTPGEHGFATGTEPKIVAEARRRAGDRAEARAELTAATGMDLPRIAAALGIAIPGGTYGG